MTISVHGDNQTEPLLKECKRAACGDPLSLSVKTVRYDLPEAP